MKYKTITKKQAIQNSIAVWAALVNEPEAAKTDLSDKKVVELFINCRSLCPACEYCYGICAECPIWEHKSYTCYDNWINYKSLDMEVRMSARKAILRDCIDAAKVTKIAYKHLLKPIK